MKGTLTILFLFLSNSFMTLAWYGHLKWKSFFDMQDKGLWPVILLSWAIAFFEYCFQVPANRMGFQGNGGPFSLIQLKLSQEIISIAVFILFTLLFFRNEAWKWNHWAAIVCIMAAVYFVFKK